MSLESKGKGDVARWEQGYHKDTSINDVEGRYDAQWVVTHAHRAFSA